MAISRASCSLPSVNTLGRRACCQRKATVPRIGRRQSSAVEINSSGGAFLTRGIQWPTVRNLQVLRRGSDRSVSPYSSVAGIDASTVLLRNGELAAAPWPAKDVLLREIGGAYTTARTVDQTAIFELSMHCQRLYDTAVAILRRNPPEDVSIVSRFEELSADTLRPLVCNEINAALAQIRSRLHGSSEGLNDYQVTLVLTWDTVGAHTPVELGFDMFTFVQPLPFVERMVDCEAHQAQRDNPTIKDLQWVTDRQHLENMQREAGVNEIIMFDAAGNTTEGLQTNFFAVDADGGLVTAPSELVLAGTVRKVVLEVAQKAGIAVRHETPSIHDLDKWNSCFIGSTSRLVKPIRNLVAPELGIRRQFPESASVAHQLEALVIQAIRGNSETFNN